MDVRPRTAVSRDCPRRLSLLAPALALCLGLIAVGCGGGGGGGGGGGDGGGGGGGGGGSNPSTSFFLNGVRFARPIFDVNGDLIQLVNPASLHEVDSLTDVPLPGFPKVLEPGTSLSQLAVVNLPQVLDPLTPEIPVIPRNGVVVLDYTRPIVEASLNLSTADGSEPGLLTSQSPIQVRNSQGVLQPTKVFVDGSRVTLSPLTEGAVGWSPTPLVFGPQGNAVQPITGHLRIVMGAGVGSGVIATPSGEAFSTRSDLLGSLAKPFPFNPGNSALDAITQQTEFGVVTFNGFLPDLTAPRIVRPVELSGTVTGIIGNQILDAGLAGDPPVQAANGGLGEWANSLLEIRSEVAPGTFVTTRYLVASNTVQPLFPNDPTFVLDDGQVLDPAVAVGDEYTIMRAEYYEPVPPPLPVNPTLLAKVTVDPDSYPRDPNDPQDAVNHDLRYFMRVFDETGLNEQTDYWDPTQGKFEDIPPRSVLRMQFSERMNAGSLRAYETFYVSDDAVPADETGFDVQRVGVVELSADARQAFFRPFLQDQYEPSTGSQFIGFGGTPSTLKLVIRTLPKLEEIAALTGESDGDAFLDVDTTGILGVTDLGGRGLGLPQALLDQGDITNYLLLPTSPGQGPYPPAVDFSLSFATFGTSDKDYGALVHRFMGQATSALFLPEPGEVADPVQSGVTYFDHPAVDEDDDGDDDRVFIYGPRVLDIGFGQPGRLTGAPGQVIQQVLDNFNDPLPSPFTVQGGPDTLINPGFGTRVPLDSPFGARFQHIYRVGDCSPSYNDFNGVVLDLTGLSWSPVMDTVTTGRLDDLEILVGLSSVNQGRGPNTGQGAGIPDSPGSGLDDHFDCNLLEWRAQCNQGIQGMEGLAQGQPPLTTVVKQGTAYQINSGGLVRPLNAQFLTTGFNFYLPFPTFNAGIDTFFGKSNIFAFPYDSNFPMIVEYRVKPNVSPPPTNNVFRFSPGIQSSALPRFRVFSQGQHPLAHCVPNATFGQLACQLGATGFAMFNGNYYRGGEGGPLLEPGTQGAGGVSPPVPNNGQIPIPLTNYILPPNLQPNPDATFGDNNAPPNCPPIPSGNDRPTCNTNPDMNWYTANGMLAYPLPHTVTGSPAPGGISTGVMSGKNGNPPTEFIGYQPGFADNGVINPFTGLPVVNEPGHIPIPGEYGGNERYYMMFNYRKRVSIIDSPALEAISSSGQVRYLRPILDPPLSAVDPAAGLRVEVRASNLLDFSSPAFDSGYINPETAEDFTDEVSGNLENHYYAKFRAIFSIAPGQTQPPALDTVVMPYEKVKVLP